MSELSTIYVYLPDEAVDVWRPVKALRIAPDLFRIEDSVPDEERWEFDPGQVVRVREQQFYEGAALVAFEAVLE